MIKNFHNCKAYENINFTNDTREFYSYQTLIAEFNGIQNILTVGENYDYSTSTRNQFSRWLSENCLPMYADVKRAINMAKEHDESEFYCDGITVRLATDKRFDLVK